MKDVENAFRNQLERFAGRMNGENVRLEGRRVLKDVETFLADVRRPVVRPVYGVDVALGGFEVRKRLPAFLAVVLYERLRRRRNRYRRN